MRCYRIYFFVTLLSLFCYLNAANFPFPQSVNYPYGIKPNNVSQDQMNSAVLSAYNSWKNAYLTQDGCPQANMWRVKRPSDGNDTVSEGIGYGMLITVLMTDANDSTKQYFDGLFRYYKYYNDGRNLMHWKIDASGNVIGQNAATDADEDVALALLFAHKQWGSNGSINYLQEATTIINALMQHCVESGTYVLKPGDVWGGSSVTNPSYFAPGFYKLFASATGNTNWNNVVNKCYDITNYFYNTYNTGLVPDWCQASGAQAGGYSYDYKYDACRFPWRYGIDYLWYGNSYVYNHLKKLSQWISSDTGGVPANIKDGYQLGGNVIGQWNNAAFVGPFAVAAMCDSSFQTWLNNLYSRLVSFNPESYYNDSLKVLTLLVITGNFPNLWSTTDSINVYLVNPSSGSIVEGSTTVVVNVYSTSNVDRVEFYVNNQLKYTDTTSPYSWLWDTTQYPDGGYELKVIGYTTSGSSDTKKTWVIINNVKEPPTILSVNLTDRITVQGTLNVTVNATDDIGISKVEFYINNVNVFTRTSSPYSFVWNTTQYQDGSYQFKVIVYDLDNLTTTYQCIVFIDNVDSPPTVSITSLQNGATLQNTVEVSISASDDKGISKIELYLDNSLISSVSNSETLSFNLDTTLYSDGLHKLKAVAYDTQNQTAQVEYTVYFDNIDDPPSCRLLFYENQVVSGTIVVALEYFDDKGISKVEYYLDNELLSSETLFPFSYLLNTKNYQDGSHTLAVIVYDTINQSTSSIVNLIFDNTLPQLSIISPQNNSISSGTINIIFSASDNYLLDRYEIYINTVLVSSKTLSSNTTQVMYVWNTLQAPTTSTINVVVLDKANNKVSQQTKIFVDNQPPAIPSINLYDEQIVSGTISIILQATDNFLIKKVEFYVDNVLLDISTQTPYSFLFNTSSVQDGRHTLKFVVYDAIDNKTESSIDTIINNSNNQPPQIFVVVNSTAGVISKIANINITCQDDDIIKSVWLYINDVFVSSFNLNTNSFNYNWQVDTTKINSNQLKLTIKAYDSLTQPSTISQEFLIDNTPPTISFQNLQNGAIVYGIVPISITATDPNGIYFLSVSLLDSLNNEIVKISTTTSQLVFNLNTKEYPNGYYIIKSKASDILNNTTESTVYITISNTDEKPTVSINLNNYTKISGNLEVKVDFSDDYGVKKLEFYINEQLVDTYPVNKSSGSYLFNYNTLLLNDAEYQLKIICYDTSNQDTTILINFIVDNIKDVQILTLDENNINNILELDNYVEEFKIYDTKGKQIYQSTSEKSWNGKDFSGAYVRPGVYIYSAKKQGKFTYGLVYVLK